MDRRAFVTTTLLLFGLSACSNGLSGLTALPPNGDETYRLSAGDQIRVTVFGFDNMTNSYTVSDTGMISVPMLKNLEVRGKSTVEVETQLAAALRERNLAPNANVSVQIVQYRPFYILGEVQKPGQYPYVPGMTVLNAVSIAGGFTFRAHRQTVAISRSSADKQRKWQATPESRLLPGDIVEVTESWF